MEIFGTVRTRRAARVRADGIERRMVAAAALVGVVQLIVVGCGGGHAGSAPVEEARAAEVLSCVRDAGAALARDRYEIAFAGGDPDTTTVRWRDDTSVAVHVPSPQAGEAGMAWQVVAAQAAGGDRNLAEIAEGELAAGFVAYVERPTRTQRRALIGCVRRL